VQGRVESESLPRRVRITRPTRRAASPSYATRRLLLHGVASGFSGMAAELRQIARRQERSLTIPRR
jgi:hypothetical protein